MKVFATATAFPRSKTYVARVVQMIVAAILVVVATAQLFTFEDFPDVIAALGLPGDFAASYIRAALIVVLEIFALPFLLSMRLSTLMRAVSMVCGWFVAAAWLIVSLMPVTSDVSNIGLLGATISLPSGVWFALLSMLFAVAIGYVSWSVWPQNKHK